MTPDFDLARARRETPGCEKVHHFDNAGAALMPRPVLDAVMDHLELEACRGGYAAADLAEAEIEAVYDQAATLINCGRKEVAIVENATRAWDMAFYAVPFKPGDRILTAKAAYASNYIAFLQMAERRGVRIDVIPDDDCGQLSVAALERMMDERVRLIAITHVPTNGGLVNPAAEVGRVAREAGVLYLLDACQSVGQMPVDVAAIGCHMLSTTGRKYLRGPRGTGFLYVEGNILHSLEPPFLDLHAAKWTAREQYEIRQDARRFENWETYVAGKIGLATAIQYALSWDLDAIWKRIQMLAGLLRSQLTRLERVTVHDLGATRCGIVTFKVDGFSADEVKRRLLALGINVSTSTVKSTRLDMESRGLDELVRASVHYYNSETEITQFVSAIKEILQHER